MTGHGRTGQGSAGVIRPRLFGSAAIVPQRALPLSMVLALQISFVSGLVVALLLEKPGWYGAAAGLGVGVLVVLRVRGQSVPGWMSQRLLFSHDLHRRRRRGQRFEPFDAELPDETPIGFHWDGKLLISLVRVTADPQVMTVMEPAVTVSGQTISAQLLADCLRQFDITV